MSIVKIPDNVRQQVATRAGFRCEYCLVHEEDMFYPYQVDHIISKKHRGSSDLTNLALACSVCNQHKGTDIATYLDPPGPLVPLFNPRKQAWSNHFKVIEGEIIALTDVGKATTLVLDMNNPDRVILRKLLMQAGRYP